MNPFDFVVLSFFGAGAAWVIIALLTVKSSDNEAPDYSQSWKGGDLSGIRWGAWRNVLFLVDVIGLWVVRIQIISDYIHEDIHAELRNPICIVLSILALAAFITLIPQFFNALYVTDWTLRAERNFRIKEAAWIEKQQRYARKEKVYGPEQDR